MPSPDLPRGSSPPPSPPEGGRGSSPPPSPPEGGRCASLPEGELSALVRIHLACLYTEGLGERLLLAFGGARCVLEARRADLRSVPGMTGPVLRKLLDPSSERLAEDELRRVRGNGFRLIPMGTLEYPAALRELPGMPLLLQASGSVEVAGARPASGIVGSRRPSLYGLRQARRFAGALARRGIVIVSGLAAGIDAEAHRAALDEGGRTVAVLGSGLGWVYPRENEGLASRISTSGAGALLSEFPIDAAPRSFHFPMRNRILSGLSDAILVVEAGERSGSLITVRHALDQGRMVYVLPGRVDRAESMGCLRLLRDGAAPAIEPEDILPGESGPAGPSLTLRSGEASSRFLGEASHEPLGGIYGPSLAELFEEEDSWHPDRIAEKLGAAAADVLAELGRLELEGKLVRIPGGLYARPGPETPPR